MNKTHSIETVDHKHASFVEGEVILTTKHSCGCPAKYLFGSDEQAKKELPIIESTECRTCEDNTAYTKKTKGYKGSTK